MSKRSRSGSSAATEIVSLLIIEASNGCVLSGPPLFTSIPVMSSKETSMFPMSAFRAQVPGSSQRPWFSVSKRARERRASDPHQRRGQRHTSRGRALVQRAAPPPCRAAFGTRPAARGGCHGTCAAVRVLCSRRPALRCACLILSTCTCSHNVYYGISLHAVPHAQPGGSA